MKILHTADLHIGNRLHELSQIEEQQLTLDWMIKLIQEEEIDVVLVAGDVFDTAQPSGQSLNIYYKFLTDLVKTDCKHIVITGGNHDGSSVLNAPKELLAFLNVNVVGKITENIEDEIFSFDIDGEKLVVAAVPYLRDQDIRKATSGETFENLQDRYKKALIQHYDEVAKACEKQSEANTFVVGMGHLFAIGGETSTSESERTVFAGGLGDIGADDFPATFDYVALGHLHRSQKVKKEHIRYSGSPYVLSFSEIKHHKEVLVLETQNKEVKIERLSVPSFRKITKIKGTLEECFHQIDALSKEENQLIPWVEIVITEHKADENPTYHIMDYVKNLAVEVLKISINNSIALKEVKREIVKELTEITPEETFLELCQLRALNLEEDPTMKDAFYEIYNKVKEKNN